MTTSYPERCVHELFADQVARTPDAVAVVFGARELSYRELDRRSNQVANHLRTLGVTSDVLVGLAVDRSLEMVVALLGILKAGGAYVPFDPTYPKPRLAMMMADARIHVMLTDAGLVAALPASSARIVDLAAPEIAAAPTTAPTVPASVDQLAYVDFTSGSTGRPKGVCVTHRAIARLVCNTNYLDVRPDDVFLQLSPLAFDASTLEVWAPLVHGARLAVAAPGIPALAELGRSIVDHRVTVLWLTAGLFHQMVDRELAQLAGLRCLLAGGDVLSPPHVRKVVENLRCRMINGYGPTENTTFTCCYEVQGVPALDASIPIGRPISHTTVHVLDEAMRPVATGEPGELYTGGDGLARGYLDRAALTAETFVPNPFGTGRLYRTGDRVRVRADGNLEFLGRRDHQVKVRGFRIELGEIEAALAARSEIREAVVVVREDRLGAKQLVAYLVGATIPRDELHRHLSRTVPGYMVPSAYVWLDNLPLTANGKVDRAALPAPPDDAFDRKPYAPPRGPVESAIALSWCEVLQLDRVGRDDEFVALGGQSLLAMRVASLLHDRLGVELPPSALLHASSVATLAREVEARASRAVTPVIGRRDREPPLSFAQLRLWLVDQITPGSTVYNLPLVIRLAGELDVAALDRALHDLHHRHETLRSTFVNRGQGPEVVLSSLPFVLGRVDVQREADPALAVRQHVETELARPFALATELPWRALLLRMREREHVLVVSMHHIVSDGWSTDVFTTELGALYTAHHRGAPAPLAPLPIQYGDFALWQRQALTEAIVNGQLAYWTQQLAGIPPILDLPFDHPRPPIPSHRGGRITLAIPPRLARSIETLARTCDATMYMTMLAAFQTLLHRYAQKDDIVVGSPIAGRTRSETFGLVGFFVNTLVMRTDFSGSPTFTELVARVRETALGAYAHQELPFERLVDELNPERSLSHTPLFQVMFQLDTPYATTLELSGITSTVELSDNPLAMFDLGMVVIHDPTRLDVTFEFARDLFDDATIARMAAHFTNLLEAISAGPDRRVAELAVTSPVEDEVQLHGWNAATQVLPDGVDVAALVERQAARTPDAIAIEADGCAISYRELDDRADRLAGRLLGLGVGSEVRVAIVAPRTIELVVGLLAIWKAGGTQVPLDPTYPPERLRLMSTLARCEVALVTAATEEMFDTTLGARLVHVDRDDPRDRTPVTRRRVSSQHAACVFFTSGSTGTPNGVVLEHGAYVQLVATIAAAYDLGPHDRVLQMASPSFDVSVEEIYTVLTRGGTVVLRDDAMVGTPAAFLARCGDLGVTVVPALTPYWHELADTIASGQAAVPASVRLVVTGGEKILPERLASWRRAVASRVRVINEYGITEAGNTSTICDLTSTDAATDARDHEVPVGRPLPNVQIYVLDARLRPVPIGVTGDIYIAGPGLARGYLDRPSLTAARFVPHPFATVPGARMYRTGDLGRQRADGTLEFVGRPDHQVKLRGYRIELGDVEATLGTHRGIREVVATVHDDRLIAHVVWHDAPELDSVREHARRLLPAYMVPSVFVSLDAMPLTPSGKLDRKALPIPGIEARAYEAPRGEIEIVVARIWSELLHVETVGRDDNFFALGGHSLLAIRVMSRLLATLAVEVPVSRLFETQTLAELAHEVQARLGETSVPLVPIARGDALPLSFAQQRLWFLHQLDPDSVAYNSPATYRLRGPLDVEALRRSFEDLVRRHEVLRTIFVVDGGVPRQHVLAPSTFTLPVEDLRTLGAVDREREAMRRATAIAQTRFDLGAGPLVIARLVRLDERDHVLVVNMHHIVTDGWSMDVLWRELSIAYAAYTHGKIPELAPLPVQYADYAAWQRRRLEGAALEGELAYWKHALAGAPSEIALPFKGPRPAVPSFRGGRIETALDAEHSAALRDLAKRHNTTTFTVLIAALRAVIARYSGQDDLCIATAIGSRTRPELEKLIGFFVNTLVLRGSVLPTDRFLDLLEREKQITLAAYAHQDAPFELVIDSLHLERLTNRAPLVQVLLVDQGEHRLDVELSGLSSAPFPLELDLASFDLSFDTLEREGVREISVAYDADLFDRDTVAELVRCYQRVLEHVLDRPEIRLSRIELVTPAEYVVRATTREVNWESSEPGVVDLIERQMTARPDAPAIISDAGITTYRELDVLSGRLAAALCTHGVGADRMVAVIAPRGVSQIVALVATLRAGGAYVPVMHDLPGERIAWMIEDTRPAAILCEGPPPVELEAYASMIVRLDEPDAWPRTGVPWVTAPLDALAYVIYTSGSTGRPKGVMITRRSFDAQMRWSQRELPLTAADLGVMLHSFSFDASVSDIFAPLMVGGTLVLPRPDGELEPRYLNELIARTQATVIQFVPSMMAVILDTSETVGWPSVRLMISGGEALTRELARRCVRTFPQAALINSYGPTETTINATSWHVRDADEVPIGRPVADTPVYVLDDQLAPVPRLVVGELWIGGVQLARGYLDRQGLTAERFVPDPFSTRPGARMYRTGDLVRERADGVLEYLGRSDHQVKVRGFRIELGEIEAALAVRQEIRRAVVEMRPDPSGAPRLVAYLLATGLARPDSAELHDFLARTLPEYMIPAAYVWLDELPRTASGKVDRRALPMPGHDAYRHQPFDPPHGRVEITLAEIWSGLLHTDRIGRDDNFFALGGNSLLVVRLVAQIRDRLGVDLSVRSVFESPTLTLQAGRVAGRSGADVTSEEAPAERELFTLVSALPEHDVAAQLADWSSVELEVVRTPMSNALHGARRELFERLMAQHLIDSHPTRRLAHRRGATAPATFSQRVQYDFHQRGNHPTMTHFGIAHALRGPLDPEALTRAIAALVARQPALRTVLALLQDCLFQTVLEHGPELEVVDLSSVRESERMARARELFVAMHRPHDLARGVFRAQLLRLDREHHMLFTGLSHSIIDGFGLGTFDTDLAALYREAVGGADSQLAPLAPLVIDNNDFGFWQTTLEDRPVGKKQLAHWARSIADYGGLELPGDRHSVARGAIGLAMDTYAVGTVPFVLDGAAWQAVERLAARLVCTPFTVVATSFFLFLSRWSGSNDVCVLSSKFHRDRPGSEAVIGNFVTPYPLRMILDEDSTLEAAVRRTHEAILIHQEHGQVAASSVRQSFVEWARYNLNYLIAPANDRAADFGGVTALPLAWDAPADRTPHDLGLFVAQSADGVRGELSVNADRFSPALARRAVARLGHLIGLVATEPSVRVRDLPHEP